MNKRQRKKRFPEIGSKRWNRYGRRHYGVTATVFKNAGRLIRLDEQSFMVAP